MNGKVVAEALKYVMETTNDQYTCGFCIHCWLPSLQAEGQTDHRNKDTLLASALSGSAVEGDLNESV